LATLHQDIVPSAKPPNAPQVPQPSKVLPPQVLSPSSSPPTLSSRDRNEAIGLIERARSFIRVGDITSARLALRRAYEFGDAQAALQLGGTYDPLMLA
jgi:hypothetical protein